MKLVDNIDLIAEDGKGFAYFSGPNVREVLDGATFFGRNALPVNGWEDGAFEGQHIQLSGMMSHRDYSNFTSFLETELAVMQDIGCFKSSSQQHGEGTKQYHDQPFTVCPSFRSLCFKRNKFGHSNVQTG